MLLSRRNCASSYLPPSKKKWKKRKNSEFLMNMQMGKILVFIQRELEIAEWKCIAVCTDSKERLFHCQMHSLCLYASKFIKIINSRRMGRGAGRQVGFLLPPNGKLKHYRKSGALHSATRFILTRHILCIPLELIFIVSRCIQSQAPPN